MNSNHKPAILKLEDGTIFAGFSFGADTSAEGEVVFNTAMAGYPELLSDPLTRGHIVVLTYPLVGNYGVPPVSELETGCVQAAGLVVTDYSEEYSHWNAEKSLGEWLREWGVPAIYGIDTRQLAKHLRERGEMAGKIVIEGGSTSAALSLSKGSPTGHIPEPVEGGEGDVTICALGEGLRRSIVASLNRRGARVVQGLRQTQPPDLVPELVEGVEGRIDGYLVTGTVDRASDELIEQVRKALASGRPVFGVCGGDLPVALAAGARIEKLSHPHRGTNQPVIERGTPHAQITTQNHAWAVSADLLPQDWEVWMENLNDGSVEGIRHKRLWQRAVQFHPEASLRPAEEDKLYDEFVEEIRKNR